MVISLTLYSSSHGVVQDKLLPAITPTITTRSTTHILISLESINIFLYTRYFVSGLKVIS